MTDQSAGVAKSSAARRRNSRMRAGMTSVIVCSFSTGIDDLKRCEQRQYQPVLRALHEAGRFSCFDASANPDIAKTMTELLHSEYLETVGGAFPWTNVRLTESGMKLIGVPST